MAKDPLRQFIILDGEYHELIETLREHFRSGQIGKLERGAIVSLTDVDRALNLYEKRVLSGGQLQEWAEVLEMEEAVCYELGAEDVVADMLFLLSTPEINEPITAAFVGKLRVSLRELRL